MRRNAFQAIQTRLESFESSRDRLWLLKPQAFEEMPALRAQIGWPSFGPLPPAAVIQRELDTIALAGRFAWAQCHELSGPDRLDGLLEATELFRAGYPFAPESVREQAAGVCAATSSQNGMDPPDCITTPWTCSMRGSRGRT